MNSPHLGLTALAVGALALIFGSPSHAAVADSDRDGMPNRWEQVHGLDPDDASDAFEDSDADGLVNLAEFRLRGKPLDEDTDNDGLDDGDERRLGLVVNDRDSDDDLLIDGHEDADRDRVANEDEDDAVEECEADDDDLDGDNVADEDENELRLRIGDVDADDDGISDGEEDRDRDGLANEDEDDNSSDRCDGDDDGDGDADEDDDDRLGIIVGYDENTATLTVSSFALGRAVSFVLTEDTEIKAKDNDNSDGSDDPILTTADLQPGVVVAELDVDDDTGTLDEIKIYLP